MKRLRRYFFALVCLASFLIGSSVPAKAAEVDVDPYHVFIEYFAVTNAGTTKLQAMTVYPCDDIPQSYEMDRPFSGSEVTGMQTRLTYATDNQTPLIRGDGEKETTVRLENIPLEYIEFWGGHYPWSGITNPTVYTVLIFYTDGSMEYVKSTTSGTAGLTYNHNGFHTIDFKFTPKTDVSKIETIIRADFYETDTQGTFEGILGEDQGIEYQIYIDQDDGTKGLLGTIIEWIKELRDKLVDGFNALKTSITELPSKILQGLKDLFVPSDMYIADFSDRIDALFADRFGAVIQAKDLIYGSWEDIQSADKQDTIKVPEVSIDLPEGNTFTFGGQDVKIVPDGFEPFAEILKGVVAVACTLLFVNGLRKRYDEVMGVET